MEKEIEWLLKEKYPEINPLDLNGAGHGKPSEKFQPVKYRKAVILQSAKLFDGLNKDIKRLKAGEPVAYVIGFIEFLGCKIDLSKNALIPRVETEYWAEKAIEEIKKQYSNNRRPSIIGVLQKGKIYPDFESFQNQSIKVLDIFSGSGCIGISVARHIKNAQVVFAEKHKKMLQQIKINCDINNITKGRYRIIQSDIFSNVTGKFDYIFSNPPYISQNRKKKIQSSVLTYEPKMALLGGKDGLFYIRKFLAKAKDFLNDDGKIYLEFDSVQKREITNLLKKYNYKNFEFFKDQYNRFRYVIIQR